MQHPIVEKPHDEGNNLQQQRAAPPPRSEMRRQQQQQSSLVVRHLNINILSSEILDANYGDELTYVRLVLLRS